MTIKIINRSSGISEPFRPAGPQVNIYVCGVTPYDACHLGHVATFLTYDILARRLHELGCATKLVRNITDLDDPILPRARKLNTSYRDLVESEVKQFDEDMRKLNFLKAIEPRVSAMTDKIIDFIRQLEASGHAYRQGNTVYFDIAKAPTFGTLSRFSPELLYHYCRERGGNPEDPNKRNPLDFVLWRPSMPGEPEIDSPFGTGMPGWHIGCSAMARSLLGTTIDLHGGGIDLLYPHHECELAQTMALQDEPFVRTWLHCEHLSYHGAKMSKSVGNIVLARDLLSRHDPGAIRLAILRQYRYMAGMEWRDSDMVEGERLLGLIREALRRDRGPDPRPWAARIRTAIDDNLDFPTAVAETADMARGIIADGDDPDAIPALSKLCELFGVESDRSGDPTRGHTIPRNPQ